MIDLLERAFQAVPSHPAVITSERTATYAELHDGAQRIAAGLRDHGIERFAVVEHDAAWILLLLAGAALAGAEPCQYEADISPAVFAEQAAASGHEIVVTRRAELTGEFERIAPDTLLEAAPTDAARDPDAPQPVLIRTTGTTGAPKTALHDWRLLARTFADVRPSPEQRWLLAYGTHQFGGVQMLQQVLAAQATLVAPYPSRPRDGLAAVSEHGVTCVSATPTYWRFLLTEARSAGTDLGALEQITLGGEVVPADLLEEIKRRCPDARISQIYGSTEVGTLISVRDGLPGFPVEKLFSEANPDSRLKIVDGELWVRATVTDDERSWRPTGDLVSIEGSRLIFEGRATDIINVGGVKVHPHPIEDRIASLDRVAVAHVFGRPNPVTGSIVAAEVVPAPDVSQAEHDQIRADIRAALAELPRASQPRSIRFVESIEIRGAKIARSGTR